MRVCKKLVVAEQPTPLRMRVAGPIAAPGLVGTAPYRCGHALVLEAHVKLVLSGQRQRELPALRAQHDTVSPRSIRLVADIHCSHECHARESDSKRRVARPNQKNDALQSGRDGRLGQSAQLVAAGIAANSQRQAKRTRTWSVTRRLRRAKKILDGVHGVENEARFPCWGEKKTARAARWWRRRRRRGAPLSGAKRRGAPPPAGDISRDSKAAFSRVAFCQSFVFTTCNSSAT